MSFVVQLLKMAALAALAALVATYWLGDTTAAMIGLAAFYLLVVRVS